METLITIGIVSAAAFYVGRRFWRRQRAARLPPGPADCGSGCDGCPVATQACADVKQGGKAPGLNVLSLVALGISLCCAPCFAADTMETFDPGAADVELYLGFDGIGPERGGRSVYGDLFFGYGLVDRLSAFVGTAILFVDDASNGEPELYAGLFATPLRADPFELDLSLTVAIGGPGFGELWIGPGVEANLDFAEWGLYLRGEVGVTQTLAPAPDETALAFGLSPGGYLRPAADHQLLLELDLSFDPGAGEGGEPTRIGGLALGYNVVLSDEFELITQLLLDVPQGDEPFAVGLMTGFIATVPAS